MAGGQKVRGQKRAPLSQVLHRRCVFGLIGGLWRVEVRRALGELLTERLGVDTTKGYKLQGRGYLWGLRNPAVMTLEKRQIHGCGICPFDAG